MSANRSDQPAAIPIDVATLRPGEWLMVVQPGPLFGTWLKLSLVVRTPCPKRPILLVCEIGDESGDPTGIALPLEFLRRLPPRSWRTWWPRARMRLVGMIGRFIARALSGQLAALSVGPTRRDALLAEVRRLRQENTDLACALAKEQTRERTRLRMRVTGGPL